MLKFYPKECNFRYAFLKDGVYTVTIYPAGGKVSELPSNQFDNIDSCIMWAAYYIELVQPELKWSSIKITDPERHLQKQYFTKDTLIQDLWNTLTDVNVDEDGNIEQDWFVYEKGIDREYIWRWFDQAHTKNVAWLLYEYDNRNYPNNVLSETSYGIDSELYLVRVSEDLFMYGTASEINSMYGVPVNQAGNKKTLLKHFHSIANLCTERIEQYRKELIKGKSEGWDVMIEEQKKLQDAMITFTSTLKAI